MASPWPFGATRPTAVTAAWRTPWANPNGLSVLGVQGSRFFSKISPGEARTNVNIKPFARKIVDKCCIKCIKMMSSSFCCLFTTYQGRYHQFSAWSYVDQNPNPFIKPSIHLPHHHLPEAEKAFEATPMMARTCVKETLDAWRGEILEKWRWRLKAKANVFRDVSYSFNPAFLTCFDTLPYLSTRSFREHWTHSLVIFVDLKFELSPIFTFTFAMRFQEGSNFSGKKKRCSNYRIWPSPVFQCHT